MNQSLFNLDNFNNKFSEKKIIEMHAVLMTNGLHFIKSCDLKKSISDLTRLIDSLDYFKNVAYISNLKACSEMVDLKLELNNCKDKNLISEFLLDTFYYDLLILEMSEPNIELCNFVLKSLKSIGLEKSLPILILQKCGSL